MQIEPPPSLRPQTPRRQRRGRERLLSLTLLLAVLAAWYGLVQWRRLPPLVVSLLAVVLIGGYASGTVSGALTRRYHGMLIAALPTLLIYILLGKYFMRGLLAGSLKG